MTSAQPTHVDSLRQRVAPRRRPDGGDVSSKPAMPVGAFFFMKSHVIIFLLGGRAFLIGLCLRLPPRAARVHKTKNVSRGGASRLTCVFAALSTD